MTARGRLIDTRRRSYTHVALFNLTETKTGEARALQPHELYRSQQYATAIYRSELALRLKSQGYDIERGKSGQPEITGYTRDYRDASSPRSQQIQAYLEQQGVKGAGAAQEDCYPAPFRKGAPRSSCALVKSLRGGADASLRSPRDGFGPESVGVVA
jgi:conjugative relaxase-like TrwC/TraI family protein